MSKQDNLTDFLTDVADAIREKKGTTEKINPQNFSEEIRSIKGGGGIVSKEFKDVNFYDYEGTILYSYTWDEFVAKNEMPPLPTHHDGLTCECWNYTLEEVLEQGGRCDVGAIYIPTDGNTHIVVNIKIPSKDVVIFKGVVDSGDMMMIEWGDGESDTYNSGSQVFTHQYTNVGIYDIVLIYSKTLKSLDIGHTYYIPAIKMYANRISFGINYSMLYSEIKEITTSTNCIVEGLPEKVTHYNCSKSTRSYSYLSSTGGMLTSVSLHPTHAELGLYDLNGQTKLKQLHIPTTTKITSSSFGPYYIENYSISKNNSYAYIDDGCVMVGSTVMRGTRYSNIPDGATVISSSVFYGIRIPNYTLPDSIVEIGHSAFRGYTTLKPFKMPKNINKIGMYAFYETSGVFDFSNSTVVPSITNSNAFNGSFKIVVPDNLYEEWIAATNWSSHASKIIKASEFVEPTTE